MGPNDTELVRVFAKESNGTIADESFPITAPFELAVEGEAGIDVLNAGGKFITGVLLRDLTLNNDIGATAKPGTGTPPNNTSSAFTPGGGPTTAWEKPTRTFLYEVPQANLANRANHVCQAIAYLSVGAGGVRDTSFATSNLFMLTE